MEQVGETDYDCSDKGAPWMANWGEDRMEVIGEESKGEMNEGLDCGEYRDAMYGETPCTAEGTEQEYTREPTGDTEEGYLPAPTGDGDDSGSEVVTPYIDGENETPTESNSVEATPDCRANSTKDGMNWMGTDNVRLFLGSWRQTVTAVADETGVSPYGAHIPSMPSAADTGKSGHDPGPPR